LTPTTTTTTTTQNARALRSMRSRRVPPVTLQQHQQRPWLRQHVASAAKSDTPSDSSLNVLSNAMRTKVAATNADPGVDTIVATLRELAEQEFGLTGVKFNEVMAKVDECYDFSPTAYTSGKGTPKETTNAAGTNNGSCKTFYFARMHGLSEVGAVRLFCEHYKDVLDTPDGDSHANIRAFMVNGYEGLAFEGEALVPRGTAKKNNDI
jgi:hypothetical protein